MNDYQKTTQLVDAIVASGRSITASREDWVNRSFELADLGEGGRALYHRLAQMDGDRYNAAKTDYNFTYALRHPGSRHLASLVYAAEPLRKRNVLRATKRSEGYVNGNGTGDMGETVVEKYRSNSSLLCQALVQTGTLTYEEMHRVAERYHLGALPSGEVIFWLIDQEGKVADGKVMLYLPNGHRNKDKGASWMSARLKVQGNRQHLFGEELIEGEERGALASGEGEGEKASGERRQKVGVVESEKTALIMAAKMPQYTWLASGGMSMLNVDKLEVLRGREVVLFPDTDPDGEAYHKWHAIALEAAKRGLQVGVSDLLERKATTEQKERKIDIADLI